MTRAPVDPTSSSRPSPIGRAVALVALAEAVTWAGLLIGMALKYGPVGTEAGVWLFGRLHGGIFVLYVVTVLLAAVRLRWSWWVALAALACSIPPLVTVPLEIWLRRSGHLAPLAEAARDTARPPGVPRLVDEDPEHL
jgi:integral membrane protein